MEFSRVTWRKSSYSSANGGACVEVGVWRKASYSASNGGNCVEVARGPASAVAVRDSKDPDGGVVRVPFGAWRGLVAECAGAVDS